MTTIPEHRLCHIDLIESIAIFFVVTYHSTLYSMDILSDPSLPTYLSYYYATILSTCVPLFFFANGYLLLNHHFTLKKHIRRMVRTLLTVFVWSPVCVAAIMAIQKDSPSIGTIADNILYLDPRYGANIFWFLGALFCIYLLFPALKALYDANTPAFLFFTATCAFFTFGLGLMDQLLSFLEILTRRSFDPIQSPFVLMFNPFRGAYGYTFVYFCIGGLACHYEDTLRAIFKGKRTLFPVLGIFFSCGLLFLVGVFYSRYVDHMLWDVVWSGYDTVFTFCNVFFIYLLSLNHTKNRRLIQTVSTNTLGIYMTHYVVIYLTYPSAASFPFMRNPLMNMVFAAFVICICLILCFVIRKIPILKRLI